ncbi:MAG: ATP-binding protein [Planctomycetaceae bacterium]
MNTTLRRRLLLGISATIIITLSATHYGMYVLMQRQSFQEFDEALAAKARALAVLVEQGESQINIEFQQHPMQEFARSVRPEYFQVWHDDGTVLARSRRLHDDDLPKLKGDRVVPQIRAVTLPDGRRGRAAGIRFRPNLEGELPADGLIPKRDASGRIMDVDDDSDTLDLDDTQQATRPNVTLVVARDTQDLETSLAGLTWLLGGSAVVATAVILGVLAWLVTRNLRTLRSLAKQIGDVNEQKLDQRFELQNAPGELHPVVTRLNDLMACLESAFLREKTFTADVAHELRTPLAGLRSTLEVSLSRERDQAAYRSSIQKCLKITEETEAIVSTLLSLSRLEAGQAALETDILDLEQMMTRTWQPFRQRAADRNVDVIWNPGAERVLKTDPAKLRVVLSNLFDNATSYVDRGGTIIISTSTDDTSNPHVTVTNTGCSLTPEHVRHACDRFWRGDTARSATGVHCGLGLALAQRIMQFLNGQIRVTAENGRFTADIQLPASCVERIEEPASDNDGEDSFSFAEFPAVRPAKTVVGMTLTSCPSREMIRPVTGTGRRKSFGTDSCDTLDIPADQRSQ